MSEAPEERKSFDLSGAMEARSGAAATDFNLMMKLLFPGASAPELVRLFVAAVVCGKLPPVTSTELAMPIAVAARLDRHEIVVALSMVAAGFDPADKSFSDAYQMMIKGSEKLAARNESKSDSGSIL